MYNYNARVRYSEVDPSGKLSPVALLDYFQDAATFHSEDAGMTLKMLIENHNAWLLNSWQIDIKRLPYFGTDIVVSTFPYAFKGYIGYRNFIMHTKEGEVLAQANSIWSFVDTKKMRPVFVSEDIVESFGIEEKLDMDYSNRKITLDKDADIFTKDSFAIEKHHLDTNSHVNNGQYVLMALDIASQDNKQVADNVVRIRADYRKQALLGDIVVPQVYMGKEKAQVALNDINGKPYANVEFSLSVSL